MTYEDQYRNGSLEELWPLLIKQDPAAMKRVIVAMGSTAPSTAIGWDEHRLRDGASFIFDEPDQVPAVWGSGERVLWAEGEGVMLVGQQGVGKTTVAQQVVLSRIGVRPPDFLGLPVANDQRPVLYLALDRPRQAARSFRRMVSQDTEELLRERLVVWRGPLPRSPLDKSALADWVQQVVPNVGTVIVDSVKDLAPGISDDKIGAALNSAWQEIIARDIELMLLHHERKAGGDAKRLHRLDDVYGSTWLTSGLGSVIGLNGDPGDPTVELLHLKQPAEPVGPLTVRHDHPRGISSVMGDQPDLLETLLAHNDEGLTAEELARVIFGRSSENEQKKIRRQVGALEKQNLASRISGAATGGGRMPDRWAASPQARFAAAKS